MRVGGSIISSLCVRARPQLLLCSNPGNHAYANCNCDIYPDADRYANSDSNSNGSTYAYRHAEACTSITASPDTTTASDAVERNYQSMKPTPKAVDSFAPAHFDLLGFCASMSLASPRLHSRAGWSPLRGQIQGAVSL